MTFKRALIAGATALSSACSAPPKPPAVDESTKRPLNATAAVDLQMCRSELTAAKIVLTETLDRSRATQALAAPASAKTATAVASEVAAPPPNQIFVIQFPLGSAEFTVPADQQAKLLAQVASASFIVIRGRTDAATDSPAETRLAERRAEAAYSYLLRSVKFPRDGVRLSWQGAGDPAQPGGMGGDRHADRRVEIELYQAKPVVQVLNAQS